MNSNPGAPSAKMPVAFRTKPATLKTHTIHELRRHGRRHSRAIESHCDFDGPRVRGGFRSAADRRLYDAPAHWRWELRRCLAGARRYGAIARRESGLEEKLFQRTAL